MIGFADSGFESDDLDLKSTVDLVFKSGGLLETVLGFEYRAEQHKMAQSMCD